MIHNPVTVIFGLVLKRIRNELSMTQKEAANAIGLKETYYRHIEGGMANLTVAKTFNVSIAFEGLAQTNAVVRILLCISHLESKVPKRKRLDSPTESWFRLGDEISDFRDMSRSEERSLPKFSLILTQIHYAYWVQQSEELSLSEIRKTAQDHEIDSEMYDFATNYMNYGIEISKLELQKQLETLKALKDFTKLPTTHLAFLIKVKNDLKALPYSFAGEDLWEWENKYANEFWGLIAIVDKPELIVESVDINSFKYEYLFLDSFKHNARIIYLEDYSPKENTKGNIHDDFKAKIAGLLPGIGRKDDDLEEAMERISFMPCPPDKTERARKLLDKFSREEKMFTDKANNLWVFIMSDGLHVGFVGYADAENPNKLIEGYTMNIGESIEIRELFDPLWNRIKNNSI